MPNNIVFKNKYTFEERFKECKIIKIKYPDRIPIICFKYYNSKINEIDKNKFLVPIKLIVGEFMFVIRKRLRISCEQAIYFLVNNCIPSNNELIFNLYNKYHDKDGFLYMFYTNENTFG